MPLLLLTVTVTDNYGQMITCGGVAPTPELALVDSNTVNIKIDGDSVVNTLSPLFFGHNYWKWGKTGNYMPGTEKAVSDMNIKLLRLGGLSADLEWFDPMDKNVVGEFLNYCKRVGAEPLLQLQIARYRNTTERVLGALDIVEYAKKRYDLKYVSVGNEPDVYYVLAKRPQYKGKAAHLRMYSADDYCADFNAIAKALKRRYPDLKLIGPDWSGQPTPGDIMSTFIEKCGDNADILSVHHYPIVHRRCTYEVVSNLNSKYWDRLPEPHRLIGKKASEKIPPIIISETNLTNIPPIYTTTGLTAFPGTFNAALAFGEYTAFATARKGIFSFMPWCISDMEPFSFLVPDGDGKRPRPRPVYHVYSLFTNYAKEHVIHANDQIFNLKDAHGNERFIRYPSYHKYIRTFAYKDDQGGVSLFIINWDSTAAYNVNVKFTNILDSVKLNHRTADFSRRAAPHSITCVVFQPGTVKDPTIIQYTNRDAALNRRPKITRPKPRQK